MFPNPIAGREILESTPEPDLGVPDLAQTQQRIHPSPTPGTSIRTGLLSDGVTIRLVLVEDHTSQQLGTIEWGEMPTFEFWDTLQRARVRQMARDWGRPVEEMRAVFRAAKEADAIRRGLMREEEGEGVSLVGEAEAGEEAEGR